MVDMKARTHWGRNEWVQLFQYFNVQSVEQMCYIIEDLRSVGFSPTTMHLDHSTEWNQAGIGQDRTLACAICVTEKFLRMNNWEQFKDQNQGRLSRMLPEQVLELKKFWDAGPIPGLKGGTPVPTLAQLDPVEFWSVTDLSVDNVSVSVKVVGVSMMTGTIEFTSSKGNVVKRAIGLAGLTAGISSTAVSTIPGFDAATKAKFPRLFAYFGSESKSLITRVLDKLMLTASPTLAALGNSKKLEAALAFLRDAAGNVSGGAASWTSRTKGVAMPVNNRPSLVSSDFSGVVMMAAVQGALAVAGGGLLYMRFGASTFASSFGNMHGVAFIETVGVAAQWPQLGISGAVFFGEIV